MRDYIEELRERDRERGISQLKYTFISDGHTVLIDVCPACREPVLLSSYRFCPYCGQRIATDTVEF